MNVRFPEICNEYELNISFQRTLRIPDDGNDHLLPPGLGEFPLRHIEDFDLGNKEHLKKRGGLIMPMFQSDALWLSFSGRSKRSVDLPIAIKVATGKINAVSGLDWEDGLETDPQNYLVVPDQPWLDGFNVGKGTVRQFVAAPLGEGLTVEEQTIFPFVWRDATRALLVIPHLKISDLGLFDGDCFEESKQYLLFKNFFYEFKPLFFIFRQFSIVTCGHLQKKNW